MLCPPLGYFQGEVTQIHSLLRDAVNFVSEDHGIFFRRVQFSLSPQETVCGDGMFSLFDAYDDISFGLELPDGLYRAFPVCPVHREFRTERGLVDLGGGRGGTDAAQDYAVGAESVAPML